ncbi:hypothetical protein [Phaeobacter sp.]|uniref:hypothetical protein n=1 Tax=Phaeobacter sp. TaxID=1902409 RepID=UPI0025DA15A1|nr:hypothetical protein [Phaeobacter sp.]
MVPAPSPLLVPAGEQRTIRVFDLEMGHEHVRFLREPGALAQILGVEEIDLDHVEIFPVTDLEELGLVGYLRDGCGITQEQLDADAAELKSITGYVLLIRSRALRGRKTRLTPANQIRFVGLYREAGADWARDLAAAATPPESAKPYSAPRPSPRSARSRARRIGASVFSGVMAVILLIVYWLAK